MSRILALACGVSYFVVTLLGYGAIADVSPIAIGDKSEIRGSQTKCVFKMGAGCSQPPNYNCQDTACTAPPPDFTLACHPPNPDERTSAFYYSGCAVGANFDSLTCTVVAFECTTAYLCNAPCGPKTGETALFCGASTNPFYPETRSQATTNGTCP